MFFSVSFEIQYKIKQRDGGAIDCVTDKSLQKIIRCLRGSAPVFVGQVVNDA